MQFGGFNGRVAALGVALVLIVPLGAQTADARQRTSAAATHSNVRAIQAGMSNARKHNVGRGHSVARWGRGGLQCVPFARENTGIELAGNANTWWSNAEGVYERGARPEVGSVLNFRANGRMRMGHVAVVSNVIDSRNLEIDHANWAGPGASRGGVSRNINVVDVSERGDWTAVRVALGQTDTFGSVYPTYGFIYDRPDKGTMVANAGAAPAPALNAPPRDLRPAAERFQAQDVVEVAEADDDQPRVRRAAHRTGRPSSGRTVVQQGGRDQGEVGRHRRTPDPSPPPHLSRPPPRPPPAPGERRTLGPVPCPRITPYAPPR